MSLIWRNKSTTNTIPEKQTNIVEFNIIVDVNDKPRGVLNIYTADIQPLVYLLYDLEGTGTFDLLKETILKIKEEKPELEDYLKNAYVMFLEMSKIKDSGPLVNPTQAFGGGGMEMGV